MGLWAICSNLHASTSFWHMGWKRACQVSLILRQAGTGTGSAGTGSIGYSETGRDLLWAAGVKNTWQGSAFSEQLCMGTGGIGFVVRSFTRDTVSWGGKPISAGLCAQLLSALPSSGACKVPWDACRGALWLHAVGNAGELCSTCPAPRLFSPSRFS